MITEYTLWDYTAKPWMGKTKFLCGIKDQTFCCDEIKKMLNAYLEFDVDNTGLPGYKVAIQKDYYDCDNCDHIWLPAKYCPFCGAPLVSIKVSTIIVTPEIKEIPRTISVAVKYEDRTVLDKKETNVAREYDNDGKLIKEWVPT
jgi:hypothetical protein